MAEAKGVTPIRLLVAIILVAVAIAATGCLTGNSDDGPPAEAGDSGGGVNPNPAGADISPAQPVIETEASEEESGLKLLKKIGPINLLPYAERKPGIISEAQRERFTLDESGSYYIVSIGTSRDTSATGMVFKMGLPSEKVVLLMILRDENGNCVAGSKRDIETGISYIARGVTNTNMQQTGTADRIIVERVSLSPYARETAKTWEVLVYG